MADWEKPNNSEPVHVNVLRDLAEKDTHTGTMGQSGTYTNRPEGFMIWDNIAKLFKRLTIGVETIIQISIAGGGTGGATAAEARANLGTNEEGTGATQTRTNAENDTVYTPLTRTVSTSGALSGGGALNGDLTLEIADSTTAQKGAVQLDNTLTSAATDKALTAAQGKVLKGGVDALNRDSIVVWAGPASNDVSNVDILSDSGFVVKAGRYILDTSSGLIEISVPDINRTSYGPTRTRLSGSNLALVAFEYSSSSFKGDIYVQGSSGTSPSSITQIDYYQL